MNYEIYAIQYSSLEMEKRQIVELIEHRLGRVFLLLSVPQKFVTNFSPIVVMSLYIVLTLLVYNLLQLTIYSTTAKSIGDDGLHIHIRSKTDFVYRSAVA